MNKDETDKFYDDEKKIKRKYFRNKTPQRSIQGKKRRKTLYEENNVKFLGSIPLDKNTRILCDKGKPVEPAENCSKITKSFIYIAENIDSVYKENDLFEIMDNK